MLHFTDSEWWRNCWSTFYISNNLSEQPFFKYFGENKAVERRNRNQTIKHTSISEENNGKLKEGGDLRRRYLKITEFILRGNMKKEKQRKVPNFLEKRFKKKNATKLLFADITIVLNKY